MKKYSFAFITIFLLIACEKDGDTIKVDLPTITSIYPTTGGYHTRVTITGTNFSDILSENHITIDNIDVKVDSCSATSITFIVPALTEGVLPIKITTPNGTVMDSSFNYLYTVYVVGYESNVAKYWRNNIPTSLTDGSSSAGANSIFIDGDDIYIAGYEGNIAKYWKNGNPISLTEGVANSIFVENNDVFVAGYTGNTAKYWKNGVPVTLTNGSWYAQANSIAIYNNDIYVAGSDGSSNYNIAKYWKNNNAISLTDGSNPAYAESVKIINNDIWIAGYERDGVYGNFVAKYWKNGIPFALSDGEFPEFAYDIAISGNDIYVVGDDNAWGDGHAKYWKNGVPTLLTNHSSTGSMANSIVVKNNDFWIAGFEDSNNYIFIGIAKYWKNGQAINLTDGTKNARAKAIYVL